MQQNVIDRFNAGTAENDAAFERAEAAGFPTQYFIGRAQSKARESGFLPARGFLVIEARYVNSADNVVKGAFASIESVGDTTALVGWCTPWQDHDVRRWKDVICSLSASCFDAGVVASFTRAPQCEEDPILRNGAWSVFGDVGLLGLRKKCVSFVRENGGKEAESALAEVADCALLHLYADQRNSDRVFKLAQPLREAYVRNACKAAYLSGAVFGEILANRTHP